MTPRTDEQRMDTLESLLEGADFAYGEYQNRKVILLHLPDGVRIGRDLRQFADDALAAMMLRLPGEDPNNGP